MSVQAFLLRHKQVPVKDASEPRACNSRWLTHRRQGEDRVVSEGLQKEREMRGFKTSLLWLMLL